MSDTSKEIGLLRRANGRSVLIAQGDQTIVVPDVERLNALIDRLKTCQAIMTSPLYKRLLEEELQQ
jgi:hypothetical protein